MKSAVSIAVLALAFAPTIPASASDVGYIYGRVETVDGRTYEGQLRWGTEESFWDDIFNADKLENENLDYVDPKVLRRVSKRHWAGWNIFGDGNHDFARLFAIRFGDLKRIQVRGGDELAVEFRDGENLRLKGGSNDIGAKITVVDARRGKQQLEWDRIRTIEFKDTPARLNENLGQPIYGNVKSGRYDFTGRIQWDNDECLTTDKLDGRSEDGKVSVPFEDIAAIRKHRQGVLVTMKSGSELYLTGTNDVNWENRGVIVVVPRLGTVKIGWRDFDEATFSPAPNSGRGYAEYARPRALTGEVVTRNASYDGRIIFDLDESRDCEMLHGQNGDTEYLIPFRDIVRIKPQGRQRADVELRMGLTIELEDSQDVSRKNDGLLIFTGDPKPKYVAWRDVTDLRFR